MDMISEAADSALSLQRLDKNLSAQRDLNYSRLSSAANKANIDEILAVGREGIKEESEAENQAQLKNKKSDHLFD